MRQGVFTLVDISMETINVIEDHLAALQAVGSGNAIVAGCDAWPGNPPGTISLVWTDVNGNGEIDHDLSGAQKHDTFTFTSTGAGATTLPTRRTSSWTG